MLLFFYQKEIEYEKDRKLAIKDGEMTETQVEELTTFRTGIAYLNEKYPSYSFVVLDFIPLSEMNTVASILFQIEEEASIFQAYFNENQFTDTFYGYLIGEDYDQYLSDMLIEFSYVIDTYSIINEPMDYEYGESLSIEAIMNGEKTISSITDLYLNGALIDNENFDIAIMDIQTLYKELDISGNFTVYVYAEEIEECTTGLDYFQKKIDGTKDYIYISAFTI